ncbi:hypothetical protein ADUPG1_006788, partial [Aduncisulcus paluster]
KAFVSILRRRYGYRTTAHEDDNLIDDDGSDADDAEDVESSYITTKKRDSKENLDREAYKHREFLKVVGKTPTTDKSKSKRGASEKSSVKKAQRSVACREKRPKDAPGASTKKKKEEPHVLHVPIHFVEEWEGEGWERDRDFEKARHNWESERYARTVAAISQRPEMSLPEGQLYTSSSSSGTGSGDVSPAEDSSSSNSFRGTGGADSPAVAEACRRTNRESIRLFINTHIINTLSSHFKDSKHAYNSFIAMFNTVLWVVVNAIHNLVINFFFLVLATTTGDTSGTMNGMVGVFSKLFATLGGFTPWVLRKYQHRKKLREKEKREKLMESQGNVMDFEDETMSPRSSSGLQEVITDGRMVSTSFFISPEPRPYVFFPPASQDENTPSVTLPPFFLAILDAFPPSHPLFFGIGALLLALLTLSISVSYNASICIVCFVLYQYIVEVFLAVNSTRMAEGIMRGVEFEREREDLEERKRVQEKEERKKQKEERKKQKEMERIRDELRSQRHIQETGITDVTADESATIVTIEGSGPHEDKHDKDTIVVGSSIVQYSVARMDVREELNGDNHEAHTSKSVVPVSFTSSSTSSSTISSTSSSSSSIPTLALPSSSFQGGNLGTSSSSTLYGTFRQSKIHIVPFASIYAINTMLASLVESIIQAMISIINPQVFGETGARANFGVFSFGFVFITLWCMLACIVSEIVKTVALAKYRKKQEELKHQSEEREKEEEEEKEGEEEGEKEKEKEEKEVLCKDIEGIV